MANLLTLTHDISGKYYLRFQSSSTQFIDFSQTYPKVATNQGWYSCNYEWVKGEHSKHTNNPNY